MDNATNARRSFPAPCIERAVDIDFSLNSAPVTAGAVFLELFRGLLFHSEPLDIKHWLY